DRVSVLRGAGGLEDVVRERLSAALLFQRGRFPALAAPGVPAVAFEQPQDVVAVSLDEYLGKPLLGEVGVTEGLGFLPRRLLRRLLLDTLDDDLGVGQEGRQGVGGRLVHERREPRPPDDRLAALEPGGGALEGVEPRVALLIVRGEGANHLPHVLEGDARLEEPAGEVEREEVPAAFGPGRGYRGGDGVESGIVGRDGGRRG